ncbi:EF-hand domain-containing protein [Roseovarius salis]|uniref:EF-hand domain-containing protein n=1 Tax=Roseovarius salis TaxID=3376063 RepID=UPI0037CA7FDC
MSERLAFVFPLVVATALGGTAHAGSHQGHGMHAKSDSWGMMRQEMGPDMMHDMSGMMQMMHQMHGDSMGRGMMGGAMMRMLDSDGDGRVTPPEMREQMQAKLAEYDQDGDGTLSISEFEALHSAMIRETMVDRFQHLDADGDGTITSEEMAAPAERMERMRNMRSGMGRMQHRPGSGHRMGPANDWGDETDSD